MPQYFNILDAEKNNMNFTDQQIAEFNAAYDLGCKRMKGLAILGGYRKKETNFFERIRAKKAIRAFEKALSIHPENWQSMLHLGKIYQRLNDHEMALKYFESALKLEHTQHYVPQEASIAAMSLNNTEKGIIYSGEALKRKPADPVLLGNHSMNLLIAGRDQEALETINFALTIDPNDEINQGIYNRVSEVSSGRMKRPTFADTV